MADEDPTRPPGYPVIAVIAATLLADSFRALVAGTTAEALRVELLRRLPGRTGS